MIPLTYLTIFKKPHWFKRWYPPTLQLKRISVAAVMLFMLSWQTATAQNNSCNANIATGLDATGTAVITPATVLEGETGSLDGYTVEIGMTGSNVFDCSMIGDTFMVTVYDPDGNQACWNSGWTVQDELAPSIQCTDLTLSCTDDTNPATMADTGVTAIDNCTTNPTLTYTEVESLGCDPAGGFGTIVRTWVATDEYGNTSSCTQTITITRPDNGHPAPSETGEPTLNNTTLNNVCMFDRTYSDQAFPNCGDAFDVVRTWTVIDWCTGDIETCTQIIKVMDNTPPTLVCPADETIGAGSNCNASKILAAPSTLFDACSADGLDYAITHTSGTLIQQGTNTILTGLELGVTTVTYTATDGCGNTNSCSFDLTVVDDAPPPCVGVNVTTGIGGLIPWTSFVDDVDALATLDNCGPITVEVSRQDMPFCEGDDSTPFGLNIPVACCDVGNVVLVDIKMTDLAGNENFCTVNLTVQEMIDPAISCPADKMISCEGYAAALMTYDGVTPDADGVPDAGATSPLAYFLEENGPGTADDVLTFIGYYDNAADNCGVTVTITDGFLDVGPCGNSLNAAGANAPFVRTYTATDDWDNTAVCTQEITIYNPNPFNPATDASFPPAEVSIECSEIGDLEEATVTTTLGCENAGVTLAQQLIVLPADPSDPTNDFCYKLLRTWEVYDWCSADPTTPVASLEQTVKVNDNDAPVLVDCTPTATSVEVGENFVFNISATDCTDAYAPTATTAGVPVVTYGYQIDQGNDGGIDVNGIGTLSTVMTGIGTNFPVGTHNVIFTATDYCGNVGTCSVVVTVTNTLDCDDFAAEVFDFKVGNNPSGTTISAEIEDLYNQPVDATGVLISLTNNDPNPQPTLNFDCSDVTGTPVDVYFYLTTGEVCTVQVLPEDNTPPALLSCGDDILVQSPPAPGGTITLDFDPNAPGDWIDANDICAGSNLTYSLSQETYDCTSASDNGNLAVTIFVEDENGNISACVVQVPYSCSGITPPMNVVTGIIGNEENGLLSNVTVSPASGMDVVTTDENGAFNMNLPTYENYEITPLKDDDYLNGVSTYDIVLISKHILGVEALDSPYKIIAADINKSGNVSTLDIGAT